MVTILRKNNAMLVRRISGSEILESFSTSGIKENVTMFFLKDNSWSDNIACPVVKVSFGWNTSALLLKFIVEEPEIRAVATRNNEAVWEDSCVEFFLSNTNDPGYYNFEFSCIGTCLLAYGSGRENREFAPDSLIEKIERLSSLGKTPFANKPFSGSWELSITIPPEALFKHSLQAFQPSVWKANFYKCGDKLTHPHFLSWNPITSPAPDFHRPEFFRNIQLID
jgi:hypothetical protein